MRGRSLFVFAVMCGASSLLIACEHTTTAPEIVAVVPPYVGALLAAERLAALSASDRTAWSAYVDRSRKAMGDDQQLVNAELRAKGLTAVIRPPNTTSDFAVSKTWTAAYVVSADGTALVNAVRSYQTASGGWGKHIDYGKGVRQPGTGYYSEGDDWAYVGTIDNGATTTELRLLAVSATAGDVTSRTAFTRGVRYLLNAQFPSGCWPQVWPLMGLYHDAATHNDDAMVGVVRFLRDVGNGVMTFTDASLRTEATTSVARSLACMLAQQVSVQGVRTTWGQQHDPLTHVPVIGRSYELPSLAGREGAGVVDVLMEETTPSVEVVSAVYAAAAFYKATSIANVVYVSGTGLVPSNGATLIWPRMMEVGTNRAIFSNRDGTLLYDFNLLTDRRTGYNWYGTEPATTIKTFDVWAKAHPLAK